MRKSIIFVICVLLGLIGFVIFYDSDTLADKGNSGATAAPPPHYHFAAQTEQTVDDPVQGFCGNTLSTLIVEGKEYTFWGGDSVELTAILINLDYSKDNICTCAAEFNAKTEFGTDYGINLSQNFVRSEKGQASLTTTQTALIRKIIDSQT